MSFEGHDSAGSSASQPSSSMQMHVQCHASTDHGPRQEGSSLDTVWAPALPSTLRQPKAQVPVLCMLLLEWQGRLSAGSCVVLSPDSSGAVCTVSEKKQPVNYTLMPLLPSIVAVLSAV